MVFVLFILQASRIQGVQDPRGERDPQGLSKRTVRGAFPQAPSELRGGPDKEIHCDRCTQRGTGAKGVSRGQSQLLRRYLDAGMEFGVRHEYKEKSVRSFERK